MAIQVACSVDWVWECIGSRPTLPSTGTPVARPLEALRYGKGNDER